MDALHVERLFNYHTQYGGQFLFNGNTQIYQQLLARGFDSISDIANCNQSRVSYILTHSDRLSQTINTNPFDNVRLLCVIYILPKGRTNALCISAKISAVKKIITDKWGQKMDIRGPEGKIFKMGSDNYYVKLYTTKAVFSRLRWNNLPIPTSSVNEDNVRTEPGPIRRHTKLISRPTTSPPKPQLQPSIFGKTTRGSFGEAISAESRVRVTRPPLVRSNATIGVGTQRTATFGNPTETPPRQLRWTFQIFTKTYVVEGPDEVSAKKKFFVTQLYQELYHCIQTVSAEPVPSSN